MLAEFRGPLQAWALAFGVFSLLVLLAPVVHRWANNRSQEYTQLQWVATLGVFGFGAVWLFASLLPSPQLTPQQLATKRQQTEQQQAEERLEARTELINNYYRECDGNISGRLSVPQQRQCIELARYRAEIALGANPPVVVQRPLPAPVVRPNVVRTITKTVTVDHKTGQERRYEIYKGFYETCVGYIEKSHPATGQNIKQCALLAVDQLEVSMRMPYEVKKTEESK